LAIKRFLELSERAFKMGEYAYTGFLNAEEQGALYAVRKSLASAYSLFGGTQDGERKMARFGSAALSGYDEAFPIVCLKIKRPSGAKTPLAHRDVLGAILALGIERATIGDIAAKGSEAYVFCAESMADFIITNLFRAGKEAVSCTVSAGLPEGPLYTPLEQRLQIASERADAIVAKAYALSREDSAALFEKEKVFVNAAPCPSGSRTLRAGDTVSVRAYGRFDYLGVAGTSKKGKLNVVISKYA